MATVRKPIYKVTYNAQDITEDISADVISIKYDDETDGTVNEIAIVVDDMDKKWKNEWLVNTGAKIGLQIGYDSDDMLDCGDYGVDEVHYKGQPDTVELKCLSIGEDHDIRRKRSHVYEKQTILQIVQAIAARNGMIVVQDLFIVDAIEGGSVLDAIQNKAYEDRVVNMVIGRIVQDRESDAGFLYRLTKLYGLSFIFGKDKVDALRNVEGKYLHLFVEMFLSSLAPVASVTHLDFPDQNAIPETVVVIDAIDEDPIELKSYDLKNKAQSGVAAISGVTVNYHDPFTDELFEFSVDYDQLPPAGKINPLQQDLNTFLRKEAAEWERIENEQQAEIIAKAKLYEVVSTQVEGRLDTEGSPLLIAGNSITVGGIGRLSGKYTITKSSHTIKRKGGWTTTLEVKMVDI